MLSISIALLLALAAPPVRVMVVTGGHPYDASFASLFEGYPEISAMVHPRNVAFDRDFRSRCDVLVLYDLTQEISDTEKMHLTNFVESGKGVVVLHHAIADYNGWSWWWREVVGGRFLLKPEGDLPAAVPHANQALRLEPSMEHSITAGLGVLDLTEETYQGMWISPQSKPLLKTTNERSDPVVAWIGPYEKSRVVVIQSGHDRKSHTHPGYRRLVRNAILWAAGR